MIARIRRFRLMRHVDVSGVSGSGLVAVGAQFPSGRCVIEWLPGRVDVRSLNIYQNLDEIRVVNGHSGFTQIEFENEASDDEGV